MTDHDIEIVSSFFSPGWQGVCSCGWKGTDGVNAPHATNQAQTHRAEAMAEIEAHPLVQVDQPEGTITITLQEMKWARVMAAIVDVCSGRPISPEDRIAYTRVGRELADACPPGSAPWFAAAMLAIPVLQEPTESIDPPEAA